MESVTSRRNSALGADRRPFTSGVEEFQVARGGGVWPAAGDVAFGHGVEVESYLDMAEGVLAKLPDDQSWISEIILKPRVKFNSRQQVEPSAIAHFHEMAHRDCFIAQSIKTKVTVRSS